MTPLFEVFSLPILLILAGFLVQDMRRRAAWNLAGMGSGLGFKDRFIVGCRMDGIESPHRCHPVTVGLPNCHGAFILTYETK
jgi:hypothetical protein